jgi:hypothetical protein
VSQPTDRVEKLVENATATCQGLTDQVLVNAKVSLQEIVKTLSPLFKVDGEIVFDDYLTCRDQNYKDAIAQLFTETFDPEKIGQITLPVGAPTFETLIPQLRLIKAAGAAKPLF